MWELVYGGRVGANKEFFRATIQTQFALTLPKYSNLTNDFNCELKSLRVDYTERYKNHCESERKTSVPADKNYRILNEDNGKAILLTIQKIRHQSRNDQSIELKKRCNSF